MFASTDVNGRAGNEDNYWLGSLTVDGIPGVVAIVADGMGGLVNSDLASAAAIRWVTQALSNGLYPTDAEGISEVLQSAHESIQGGTPDVTGTTFTYVAAFGGKATVVHLGDSRAYIIPSNSGFPQLLTEDHTELEMRQKLGEFVAPADRVAMRSRLTRAVGPGAFHAPFTAVYEYNPGDAFLLCSDGFWHSLESSGVAFSVSQETIEEMIQLAVTQYKERDNITAIGFVAK